MKKIKNQITLLDKPAIERTLKRMAIQVWENLADKKDVVIIGLNERGFATAKLLTQYINHFAKAELEVHQFSVHNSDKAKLPDCNDKFVLLVDDVIFSGRTMFDALSAICSINEPSGIEIAALLDRGHRRYPLRTDLRGKKVPTKLGEHIEVMLNNGILEQAILFRN